MQDWLTPQYLMPALGALGALAMWILARPSDAARTSIAGFQALSAGQAAHMARLAEDLHALRAHMAQNDAALADCHKHRDECEATIRELDRRLREIEARDGRLDNSQRSE